MAKFEEILPALRDGKKVRRSSWFEKSYIFVVQNEIFDEGGYYYSIANNIFANDWEIVEEPKPLRRFEFEGYLRENKETSKSKFDALDNILECSVGFIKTKEGKEHSLSLFRGGKFSKWKISMEELPDEN